MNYLKRARISIARNKGKSILLFFIIFVLANVIAGALAIQDGSKQVAEKIKSELGAVVTIEMDHEAIDQLMEEDPEQVESIYDTITPPSKEVVTKIGELPYVKNYDYTSYGTVGSESMKAYIDPIIQEEREQMEGEGSRSPDDYEKYYAFNTQGIHYNKVLAIEEGRAELVEGRVFTPEEIEAGASVGLISKELAELNNLKVGDKMPLTYYELDYDKEPTEEGFVKEQYDLPIEIIGIYKDLTIKDKVEGKKQDEHMLAYQKQEKVNKIYVPNGYVREISKLAYAAYVAEAEANGEEVQEVDDFEFYDPIYILQKPEDVEAFKEEAQLLLPEYSILKANSDQYEEIAGPVASVSKIAKFVMIAAVVATVIIITLVVLLFLRDRKKEFGIYLAIGEKKGKVVGQMLAEVLTISLIAITLAVFSGNLIAKNVSTGLIEQQVAQQEDDLMGGYSYSMNGFDADVTTEDVVEAYEVKITPAYIGTMYGVGLGTVIVATIIPMTYLVRLNPKKILL